ncbi:MAG: hypothetical protein ABIN89_31790 [Chitinophagaceae bacterium]
MPIPIILIHGYSDKGQSFLKWKQLLIATGKYTAADIHICSYRTLTNEVTIKDVAEGFDRALRINTGISADQPFDAIVHSTGMLVLRSWLTVFGRHQRLKHIIALAPASFGSPLAHKGRSWIGSIFKGSRELGPDFLEAGDLVLDGLELGSRFTWDLAHKDLLGEDIFYGPTDKTPYVFTFCGNKQYGGLRGAVVGSPGTDGTVRWSGASLDTRKITLDFTKHKDDENRYRITDWPAHVRANLAMPFIPVDGLNHASILENPSAILVGFVMDALSVTSSSMYNDWIKDTLEKSAETIAGMQDKYQQFLIKAADERGDGINDYNLQLYKMGKGKDPENEHNWEPIKIDVHSYSSDNSYRCFHINLRDLLGDDIENLKLEFMASSGTVLLGYFDYTSEDENILQTTNHTTFTMDLSPLLKDAAVKFFYPFTTTLIEIILNREPLPFKSKNEIAWFL